MRKNTSRNNIGRKVLTRTFPTQGITLLKSIPVLIRDIVCSHNTQEIPPISLQCGNFVDGQTDGQTPPTMINKTATECLPHNTRPLWWWWRSWSRMFVYNHHLSSPTRSVYTTCFPSLDFHASQHTTQSHLVSAHLCEPRTLINGI